MFAKYVMKVLTGHLVSTKFVMKGGEQLEYSQRKADTLLSVKTSTKNIYESLTMLKLFLIFFTCIYKIIYITFLETTEKIELK